MIKKIPLWFWVSLSIFCVIQLLMVPISLFFTNTGGSAALVILFFLFVVYPVFFIIMFTVIKKKVKLTLEEMVLPTALLLIPTILYIPFFAN